MAAGAALYRELDLSAWRSDRYDSVFLGVGGDTRAVGEVGGVTGGTSFKPLLLSMVRRLVLGARAPCDDANFQAACRMLPRLELVRFDSHGAGFIAYPSVCHLGADCPLANLSARKVVIGSIEDLAAFRELEGYRKLVLSAEKVTIVLNQSLADMYSETFGVGPVRHPVWKIRAMLAGLLPAHRTEVLSPRDLDQGNNGHVDFSEIPATHYDECYLILLDAFAHLSAAFISVGIRVCSLGDPQMNLVADDPVDRGYILYRVMTLDEINHAVRTKLRKEKLVPVSDELVVSRTEYLRGNPKDDMTQQEMDRLRFREARYVRMSASKSDEER